MPVNPGRVDWSGENPGIYLKEHAEGDYTALGIFFRVVLSPHGRGHGAIVLDAPDEPRGYPDARNLCLTDNQRLMDYLIEGWVRKFPTFRGRPGLDAMTWIDLEEVEKRPGNLKDAYSEILRGPGTEVELTWRNLGAPFAAEVGKAQSATGEHDMYSVFLEAKDASIRVNGETLGGSVQNRQFFGRTMSTAFLALSETWVTPAN